MARKPTITTSSLAEASKIDWVPVRTVNHPQFREYARPNGLRRVVNLELETHLEPSNLSGLVSGFAARFADLCAPILPPMHPQDGAKGIGLQITVEFVDWGALAEPVTQEPESE